MEATTSQPTPYRPRKTNMARLYAKHKALLLMLVPAIAFYLVFNYAPLYGLQLAFKDYMYKKGIWGSPWVGLEHFQKMFTMRSFHEVFGNTLILSFWKLVIGFPAPILFAILINELRQRTYQKFVQTVSYLPHFISWVVLGGLFIQLLSPSYGPVNLIIKALGFEPIYFLGSNTWFRPVLVATSVWKGVGWGSIIYIAALSNVDTEQLEAATIDGANRFQSIWHVTLPSLMPVITIMLIFAAGGIINDDFDQIFNLMNDSVLKTGDVLSTYTYRMGLVKMQYSFSTAVGLFKNVVSFSLIALTNAIAKRINDYGLW